MNHLEFAAYESAQLEDTPAERWLSRLEKLLGFDLDGDHETDGFSIDGSYDLFKEGKTIHQAAEIIKQSIKNTGAQ